MSRHDHERSRLLERLRAAHVTVAALVIDDSAYLPIFERLEAEIAEAEADPIARARAVVARQKAMA